MKALVTPSSPRYLYNLLFQEISRGNFENIVLANTVDQDLWGFFFVKNMVNFKIKL